MPGPVVCATALRRWARSREGVRTCLATVVALLFSACGTTTVELAVQAPATLGGEPPGHELAVVRRVVDGDTIEVVIAGRVDGPGAGQAAVGRTYTVRMLGIDTPESVDPSQEVECFGPEASAATEALVAGADVTLVRDVEEKDRYGRLLRFVYMAREMANARLVANGYARAYPYSPNLRHARLFDALEEWARTRGLGLWAEQTCGGAE